jgi:hypothetical protein
MARRPPDIHKRLLLHMEAVRKRDAWARKGIAWSKAGNLQAARNALKHAQRWDQVRRKLEEL